MHLRTPVVSPEFREATRVALALQVPVALICLLALDGGRLARTCGIAMTGFWLGAALIAARRTWNPTRGDLWYWRWGFVFCFALAICCAGLKFA